MRQSFDTELEVLIDKLPPHIQEPLRKRENLTEFLEVVLDKGRQPEARSLEETFVISSHEVTEEDLQNIIDRIGSFGGDNRAGIERTLHRISAIRNRNEDIVGLTLRIGRAVYGTIKIIEDLVFIGKSILLVGRPGVGKTTMLREVARVLADDARKRVIVVDTSNEIAGDGDIPHPGIGHARRMQVRTPTHQHSVMIEAVENHMPEVIIIDEIGTELDASASRTIAERGVQLVATAHGNTLENLIMNPTLSDLVGGVQTVTLGDIEARRRRTQKSVQERTAPPTFDILVEIQGWNQVTVHADVAETVDGLLRGHPITPEERTVDENGEIQRSYPKLIPTASTRDGRGPRRIDAGDVTRAQPEVEKPVKVTRILPYGVNKGKLQQVVRASGGPVELVESLDKCDLVLTIKNYYRRRTEALRKAEDKGKPVYVLRKNTVTQIEQFIKALSRKSNAVGPGRDFSHALVEAEDAATRVDHGEPRVELTPQGAFIRHLQHKIAEEYGISSGSTGRDTNRRVVIYRG